MKSIPKPRLVFSTNYKWDFVKYIPFGKDIFQKQDTLG